MGRHGRLAVISGPTIAANEDLRFVREDGTSLSLTLYRAGGVQSVVSTSAVPTEEGAQPRYRESAARWNNWIGGACHARREQGVENVYAIARRAYTREPNLIMPAGAMYEVTLPLSCGRINNFRVFNGSLYGFHSNGIFKIPSGTGAPENVLAVGSGGFGEVFKGSMYYTVSGSALFTSSLGAAGTWSSATTGTVIRSRLATVNWTLGTQFSTGGLTGSAGTSGWFLVGTDQSGTGVYHVAQNPMVATDWSGLNPVGDTTTGIQQLYATQHAVFASRPDGVYMIRGGGQMPNLSPWWSENYDPNSGGALGFFDDFLYGAHGQYLDMISPDPSHLGQPGTCQPGFGSSFEVGPVLRRMTAWTLDTGWLVAAFYDGSSTSYVFYGKRADKLGIPSRNPMIWHGYEADLSAEITAMRIWGAADPRRLYLATWDGSTARLFWQSQAVHGSPLADYQRGGGHRFTTGWSVDLPAEPLGDDESPKTFRRYGAVTRYLQTGNSLTMTATVDDDPATVDEMTFSVSPRETVVAPTNARGNYLNLTLTGSNLDTTPIVVRAVKARGTVNDERTQFKTYAVVLGQGVIGSRQTQDDASSAEKARALYGLLEEGPLTLIDYRTGTQADVVVEDVADDEKTDPKEQTYTRFARVSVSFLSTPSVYESARYGSGFYS